MYKGCRKWLGQVKLNPKTLEEQQKFENSDLFKTSVLEPISNLVGSQLDLETLDAIWVACSFGQAWQPQKLSPYCGFFNQNQIKLMEFRENLEYYYVDSYGNDINLGQSCVLIQA
jgi:multiple inositol-polyphosphate phosphatase/2,3-bisphosphoglycerate 3-phosphatase